jgi:hypothetical protein
MGKRRSSIRWLFTFKSSSLKSLNFQISTKNTNLVEDHPMIISGKFGSNLFSGFREEDLKFTKAHILLAHLAIGHVSFCHG